MYLRNLITGTKTISIKLTFWYVAFFVVSVSLLFGMAYFFLSQTLQRDDHRAIKSQLQEVSLAYSKEGLSRAGNLIKKELLESKKFRKISHFFYRFAKRNNNTIKIFFSDQWADFELARLETVKPGNREWIVVPFKGSKRDYFLEVTSTRLPDGC